MSDHSSIEQKKNLLVERLTRLKDRPNDRYQYLIDMARKLPAMDRSLQLDAFLVPGCLSRVWLIPTIGEGGILHFQADADAQIPKGIVALVLSVYNDEPCDSILSLDPSFLEDLGLSTSLSMNRRDSVVHFVAAVRKAAEGFLGEPTA